MDKKLLISVVLIFFVLNCRVYGIGQPTSTSSYVVIGAFAVPGNAVEFASHARQNDLSAEYALNSGRHLFYVYVLVTEDRQVAIERAKALRQNSPYDDTWVYTGPLGDLPSGKGNDLNPATGETISKVQAADDTPVSSNVAVEEQKIIAEATTTEPKKEAAASIDDGEPGKVFIFKVKALNTGEALTGEVDIIDMDRTKKAASYKANENVKVRSVNKSGNISASCEVFGYRKAQIPLNYNDPGSSEGVEMENNVAVVPFALHRLQKGDFAVMYNVYFYRDAAVMRPESRYEVTSLLNMLKENPKYKIRIHGHTNGNAHGKIISTNDRQNGFFSLDDVKEGFGSAKKLSEERGKVIQDFLIASGIEPGRMQVKAWGGKRPVYDKNSQQAQANVRVEIEILEN